MKNMVTAGVLGFLCSQTLSFQGLNGILNIACAIPLALLLTFIISQLKDK